MNKSGSFVASLCYLNSGEGHQVNFLGKDEGVRLKRESDKIDLFKVICSYTFNYGTKRKVYMSLHKEKKTTFNGFINFPKIVTAQSSSCN
jgi:hypothetical protein